MFTLYFQGRATWAWGQFYHIGNLCHSSVFTIFDQLRFHISQPSLGVGHIY